MPMAELKIQIPPLLPEGERVFKGCVSASELELMELFEDYTCMICHCPNPRNTHIFGNCIIQSTPSVSPKLDASTRYPSHSFLTVCFLCNKNFGHGKNIYMYRYKRVNLEGQAVKLNRAKLEACLTCPLCNKLFNNATTIFECLHTCQCTSSSFLLFYLSFPFFFLFLVSIGFNSLLFGPVILVNSIQFLFIMVVL
ncbi:protein MARD1-like isoform X1 [Arachis stenosperma]|uniref:protein MARD1-like isoform X1 n=1 Tax=Arachis stenosperma TaxID=217475 RepID=UPI0025AC1237|nr:protein MARD1-like isoform X1 [Arachis stenosperma]